MQYVWYLGQKMLKSALFLAGILLIVGTHNLLFGQFTITTCASGCGTVSPPGTTPVQQGQSLTYAITANPCCYITAVTVDGQTVGIVPSYTFTNVQANHTICATFQSNTATGPMLNSNQDVYITSTAATGTTGALITMGYDGTVTPSGSTVPLTYPGAITGYDNGTLLTLSLALPSILSSGTGTIPVSFGSTSAAFNTSNPGDFAIFNPNVDFSFTTNDCFSVGLGASVTIPPGTTAGTYTAGATATIYWGGPDTVLHSVMRIFNITLVIPGVPCPPMTTLGGVSGSVQEWTIPGAPDIQGLTTAKASNAPSTVWFTEFTGHKIGSLALPKVNAHCPTVKLTEVDLSQIDGTVPFSPFKIAYAESPIPVKYTSKKTAKANLWFTDPVRGTICGVTTSTHISTVLTFPTGNTLLTKPWGIKWHQFVSGYAQSAYLWVSNEDDLNQLFAFNPTTKALRSFTIPGGFVKAFTVVNGTVWIAASDSSSEYIYRWYVNDKTTDSIPALEWKYPKTPGTIRAIAPLYYADPLKFKLPAIENPSQVWIAKDGEGPMTILALSTNGSPRDTMCNQSAGLFHEANGLFAPLPPKFNPMNRMLATEGLIGSSAMSVNFGETETPIDHDSIHVAVQSYTTEVKQYSAPVRVSKIQGTCTPITMSNDYACCVRERYHGAGPFDFTGALLDIDMVGVITPPPPSTVALAAAVSSIAFHEPSPKIFDGSSGVIGRITIGEHLKLGSADPSIGAINAHTGKDPAANRTPEEFQLFNAYPNPFNPTTDIAFSIPKQAMVTLTVYNALGQEVAILADGKQFEAGMHTLQFDGGAVASGVYYFRISAQTSERIYTSVKSMMLVK